MNVLTESLINKILSCEICQNKYDPYDEPKIIPCGLTICSKCGLKIDERINNETMKFRCESCGNEHSKPVTGFPKNKIANDFLTTPLQTIYRGESFEALKLHLKSIEESLNEITFNIENSDFKVKDHCVELRRLVQLSTEEKIEQINKQNDLLIKEIDDYERECLGKINKDEIAKIIEIEEIKLFLKEKNKYLERLNKTEENEMKKSNQKASDYELELQEKKNTLLGLIFNFEQMKFFVNNKKVEDNFIGKLKDLYQAKRFDGHDNHVYSLAVLHDGSLASGSKDYTIRIWNVNTCLTVKLLVGHTDTVSSLAVLHNGSLASGSYDKTIRIWNVCTGLIIKTLNGHTKPVNTLVVTLDDFLVSGSCDNMIIIWNITNGSLIKTLTDHAEAVWSLAVLQNGLLASGNGDNTIRIWDLNTKKMTKLTGHSCGVFSLAALHNGSLASGSHDNTIIIWNLSTGSTIRKLIGHTGTVYSLAVLQGGLLASGSYDTTIRIWNVNSGSTIRILNGHTGNVLSLAVLQNGLLASGSEDNSILIQCINKISPNSIS